MCGRRNFGQAKCGGRRSQPPPNNTIDVDVIEVVGDAGEVQCQAREGRAMKKAAHQPSGETNVATSTRQDAEIVRTEIAKWEFPPEPVCMQTLEKPTNLHKAAFDEPADTDSDTSLAEGEREI